MTVAFGVVLALVLTLGVVLARRGRYAAHRRVQVFAVAFAAGFALWAMALPYWAGVSIGGVSSLQPRHQWIATGHSVVGALALAFGVLVVLRATGVLGRLPPRSFVPSMRVAYALFMLAITLGLVARFV